MFTDLGTEPPEEDTRYPHSRKQREEDTETEHEPKTFDKVDTNEPEHKCRRKRGNMRVPNRRP